MTLQTFFEKFDQFTDAPNAVARMRRFILDLAVRGKLVAQDANDEPADDLLKRVQAEKARLVESGEIKKQELLPPVAEDAIPFSLPSGWVLTQLGDVAVCLDYMREPINGTERDLRIAGKRQSELFPYYGATQQQGWINDYIFDAELVLLGEDGVPFFDDLRPKAYLISGKSWVNNHAHVFRGILVSNPFVMDWLNTFDFTGRVAGSTRSKLNQAKAVDIPIALPPLAEQKRIVAKVDELMALCDRLEGQQQERETRHAVLARAALARFADAPTPANLNFLFHKSYPIPPTDLRKSIYQAAFDGVLTSRCQPMAMPTGWILRDIASLCVIEDGDRGSAYPKKQDFSESGHCVFLNTKNVRRHGFDFTTMEWITKEKHQQLRKGMLVRGDIVFTSRGTIGNVAHYDETVPFEVMRINSGMFILRGFERHMEASFLSRLLRAPQIRSQIDSLQSGSAQPQLPIREFRKFTAKVPPLAEQRRIVAKVDQLMALVDQLEAQLTESRAIAQSLMEAVVAELTQEPHR